MTNGGTGPYNGSLLVVTDGFGLLPPSVVLVNPKSPNNVTVLLDNFLGDSLIRLMMSRCIRVGKYFLRILRELPLKYFPSLIVLLIRFSFPFRLFVIYVCLRRVCLLLADRYGFELNYRPQPEMPRQVYMFDPITGAVRVVADGFDECNGIAFTKDGKTAFM